MSNETLNLASDAKVSGRLETNEFKLTDDDKRQIFDISNITANTERICVFPDADSRVPANNSTSITTNLSVPVGANNTFYGIGAGSDVTTGTDNIIVGYDATAGTSSAVGRIVLGIEGKYNNCFHLPSNTMYLPNLANNIFSNVVYYDTVTKTIAYGLGGGGGGGGSSNMPDGTALIPGLKFENEQSTGFFRGGAGQFSISVGGTERFQFNGNQIETTQQTSPTYSFISATTSGMGFSSSTLKFYNTSEQLSLGTTSNFFTKGVFISHSNNTNKDVYDGTTFSQVFAVGADTDNGLGNYKMGFSFDTSGSNLNFNYLQTAQNVRMGFIRTSATATTQGSEIGQMSFYVKPTSTAATEILRLDSFVNAQVPVVLQSGSESNPSLTFASDTDTGIYRVAANTLGFATGGTNRISLSTSTLTSTVKAVITNAENNSTITCNQTDPAYASSTCVFNFTRTSSAGFNIFRFITENATTKAIMNGLGNWLLSGTDPATPAYSFVNDTDTGIYNAGANALSIAAGGAQCAQFNTAQTLFLSGSASNPSISFLADSGAGMYTSGANTLDFATAGTNRVSLSTLTLTSSVRAVITNTAQNQPGLYLSNTHATYNSNGALYFNFTRAANSAYNIIFCYSNSVNIANFTGLGYWNIQLGTASTPAYSFVSDTNTGMFSSGADTLDFSTGGTSRLTLNTASLTCTLPIIGPNGGTAAPGVRCTSEATGFSVPSAGTLAFSVAGSSNVNITAARVATGIPIYTADGASGTPSYTFSSDTDTGIYLSAANTLSFAAGGTSVITVGSAATTINNPATATSFNVSSPGDSTTPAFALRAGTGMYEDSKQGVIKFASSGTNVVTFGPTSSSITGATTVTGRIVLNTTSLSSSPFSIVNNITGDNIVGLLDITEGRIYSGPEDIAPILSIASGGGSPIFLLRSYNNGNLNIAGAYASGGADFAEFFETESELDIGDSVVLVNEVIRKATAEDNPDDIFGIVRPEKDSEMPLLIGNAKQQKKRIKTNDYGVYLTKQVEYYEWTEDKKNDDGTVTSVKKKCPISEQAPINAKKITVQEFIPNDVEYVTKRSVLIGLVGQVPIAKSQPKNPRWRKIKTVSEQVDIYLIR